MERLIEGLVLGEAAGTSPAVEQALDERALGQAELDRRDESVNGTFEALGAQLERCQLSAEDCLKTADCDATKDQACRAAAKTCHDNNRAAFEAFGKAIETCVQQKHTCTASAAGTGAASAGTSGGAKNACRQELQQCVTDAKPAAPPPDPCMAALQTCMQDSSKKPMECFEAAKTCVMDRLPPRCTKPHVNAGQGGSAGTPVTAGRGPALPGRRE